MTILAQGEAWARLAYAHWLAEERAEAREAAEELQFCKPSDGAAPSRISSPSLYYSCCDVFHFPSCRCDWSGSSYISMSWQTWDSRGEVGCTGGLDYCCPLRITAIAFLAKGSFVFAKN
eukprot:108807-Amphidinium_carterae.1